MVKIDAASLSQAAYKLCDNSDSVESDTYCMVELSSSESLSANTSVTARAVSMPDAAGGGGGGEIGNPNGDGNINLADLGEIKNAIGAQSGDACYKPWADFDLSGSINLSDLGVLKDNLGRQFDTNDPNWNPTLVKDGSLPDTDPLGPLPSSCAD